jgi:hypothetical protein
MLPENSFGQVAKLLFLTGCGPGTCVEVSVTGYPEIVRTAADYPGGIVNSPDFPANRLREFIENNVSFPDR